jgi:hypothetical protein
MLGSPRDPCYPEQVGRLRRPCTRRDSVARTKDASLAERNRRICLMRRNGFTFSEIADMEGISRARVSQIIAAAVPELPEDETRAEIASLLEFAERKAIELINNPGYVTGPNGKVATDQDGEPVVNNSLVDNVLKTLVLVADRKARLYGADRPVKRTLTIEAAQQQAGEAMAAVTAKREAERLEQEAQKRELEAYRQKFGQVIPGQVVAELEPGAPA